MPEPLLRVENLRTHFRTPRGVARAVDGVSFALDKGCTLGLVGESGCGKSMSALSILQLVPEPGGYIEEGRILFDGLDLLDYTWEEMRAVRGRDIAMIFQEPMTSLNPSFTIGWQVMEALIVHGAPRSAATQTRARDLLGHVGLPDPGQVMAQYPHELSGGMRQRVMIAMALANSPRLLIADEPTTALDVTVQAQILALLGQLRRETGMAMLLITHDLGIVSQVADRVAVMYAGQIVEHAGANELFRRPQHPYSKGLLASRPSRARRGTDLDVVEGTVPDAAAWPPGCRFHPRCPYAWDACATREPRELPAAHGGTVKCHLYDPDERREGAKAVPAGGAAL